MSERQDKGASLRLPSLLQSLTPIAALIALLSMSIWLFGADSSQGANQVALTLAAAVAALIAIYNGERWTDILQAIVNGISTALGAVLILFAIGATRRELPRLSWPHLRAYLIMGATGIAAPPEIPMRSVDLIFSRSKSPNFG